MRNVNELRKIFRKSLHPLSKLTVSCWADEYRQLPSESSEPGRWHTSRVPYMRAVMDAFTDPQINRIVVKSASQVSKSEVLLNIVGRTAHLDPATIMIIQPTLSDAEDFRRAALAA